MSTHYLDIVIFGLQKLDLKQNLKISYGKIDKITD